MSCLRDENGHHPGFAAAPAGGPAAAGFPAEGRPDRLESRSPSGADQKDLGPPGVSWLPGSIEPTTFYKALYEKLNVFG
jgi:hypothetical protein